MSVPPSDVELGLDELLRDLGLGARHLELPQCFHGAASAQLSDEPERRVDEEHRADRDHQRHRHYAGAGGPLVVVDDPLYGGEVRVEQGLRAHLDRLAGEQQLSGRQGGADQDHGVQEVGLLRATDRVGLDHR